MNPGWNEGKLSCASVLGTWDLFLGRRVPGLQLLWAMDCMRKGGRALLGLLGVTEKASKATMAHRICLLGRRALPGAAGGDAQSREDFPLELKVQKVA